MKIGIISSNAKLYSTSRLTQAARARGHTVKILHAQGFSIDIRSNKPDLLYHGKTLPRMDAIIPRVAASQNFMGTAVIRQFEQMGTYTLNASHAVSVARDKLRSLQILSRHRVGIPPSMFVMGKSDINLAIEKLGGAPLIIKLIEGSQGAGVMLAETDSVARAIIETVQLSGHDVLIQKFVKESSGRDIRAFVVGNKVVAAMRRTAQAGEFRSNVHKGGVASPIDLDPEYERVALQAAHIIGLRVAGVDMLESDTGPKVLEVNSSPGLEGIESATHVDVADAIISYLEEQVLFPDLDLRERMSLGKGYSIVDIPVIKNSRLSGQRIVDLELSELELQVLSINRNGITIPTPRPVEEVMEGDLLLVYGKQLILKSLLPEKKTRKKRRTRTLSQEHILDAQRIAREIASIE